jgi:hypothetical protein
MKPTKTIPGGVEWSAALFLSVAAFWTVIHGATESPAEAGHNVAGDGHR